MRLPILAVREKRQVITTEDLNEAMMKIIAGPQKKSRKQLQRDLRITAIHEAGHAVAMYRLPNHDPVHQITIVPRGRANGLTVSLPEEETSHMTRNEMYEEIVAGLGDGWRRRCSARTSQQALPRISVTSPRWPGIWWPNTA